MIGVVWGLTISRANSLLQKVIEDYAYCNIKPLKQKISFNEGYVKFENGDKWRAVGASECWRGIKCNVSYIDIEIPQDFIDTIIKYSTCVRPYQAFRYYCWPKGDNIDEENFI